MKRADYEAPARQFLTDSSDTIIGSLAAHSFFSLDQKQRNAWLAIIDHLKAALIGFDDAYVFLEFIIPRMGRRVDALILHNGCIHVLEYKIGSEHFSPADRDQVFGYALDLKNFHEPSHRLPIVPILIATSAPPRGWSLQEADDQVCEPVLSNGANLSDVLVSAGRDLGVGPIDPLSWVAGRYKPTPTIVEAAQALYRNHHVDDITRHEAGAENLSKTAAYVSMVIECSKSAKRKAICFITGVPGSGKTLAGLNIASLRTRVADDEYAVFLSGNGPLVKVLRAALDRDQRDQARARGQKVLSREREARSVEQFIQNIHHFRDANLGTNQPPVEKVVLFDEAQRAWNTQAASQFMKKKRNRPDFAMSEPEFLLSVMNRHEDWCTVICLVGNGQEINTGEAGLNEWLTALRERFSAWEIHISDRIVKDPESFGVGMLPGTMITERALHLSTAIRSFRSESVSSFVSAIIDGKPDDARILSESLGRFEFRITRDLDVARRWLHQHRRGTERAGLLAFSNAARLKPEGVFVKAAIDPIEWFLAERADIRSCDYLEDSATEFDVQGLELDWTCVCVDANLRITESRTIDPVFFRGTRWQMVKDTDRRRYILNAHRVLLTRARQGVIVFVPNGDIDDPTRNPRWYDALLDYFVSCGVRAL